MNSLIFDIDNYIEYLNQLGLNVTLHGNGIEGLFRHNVHKNPFCSFVKTDDDAWGKCVACQQKVFKRYEEKQLFGMCYAGVEEYVFFVNKHLFVSVSGYGINKEKAMERISRLSNDFYLDKKELFKIYESGLKHEKEDLKRLSILIHPLCQMLRLSEIIRPEIAVNTSKNKIYDDIMQFIQRNYMNSLTVDKIAKSCSCSQSTVNHLFKKINGTSIKKYIIKLRIEQAEKLLVTSNLPINDIALMCGFLNINYFSTAFRKETGFNPSNFRKANGS